MFHRRYLFLAVVLIRSNSSFLILTKSNSSSITLIKIFETFSPIIFTFKTVIPPRFELAYQLAIVKFRSTTLDEMSSKYSPYGWWWWWWWWSKLLDTSSLIGLSYTAHRRWKWPPYRWVLTIKLKNPLYKTLHRWSHLLNPNTFSFDTTIISSRT